MPWLRTVVVAGAIVGGCIGARACWRLTIGHRTSPVGIAVGALSTAVLGGWFAFLGGSFWAIFRQGWREASPTSDDERANR